MGSRGGSAPNPYLTRHAKTRFLRVPLIDWPSVKIGRKTEYRRALVRPPRFDYKPTPVVGYALRGTTYDHGLLVLEEIRQEFLWDIKDDDEALAREGMESYEQFRAYWKTRHHNNIYKPLTIVQVFRVRPLDLDADIKLLGGMIFLHLHKDFL